MKLPKKIQLKKLLKPAIISATLLVVFSIIGVATAQEIQRTITLVNPTIEQKLDPGGYAEGKTKIINDSSGPLTFKVGVQDFIVTDTLGTPNLLPPDTLNTKYSAASWIGISPDTFTLKPGEKQEISYWIQVPKDARPGGHYAAIVYTPVVDKTVQGTGSTVNTQLGSLFYITVNGPVTENSIVSKFFTNPFQEYGPVNILTQIKNLGDLHVQPKGTVTVSGLFYNKTKDLPLHNIFPQTARDYETAFGQTFMLGRYKAILMASYGVNNNMPLTATLYFWVFPWRLALLAALLIVATLLGALYLKRKKQSPKDHTEAENEQVKTPEEK